MLAAGNLVELGMLPLAGRRNLLLGLREGRGGCRVGSPGSSWGMALGCPGELAHVGWLLGGCSNVYTGKRANARQLRIAELEGVKCVCACPCAVNS